ncbi:MAG: 4-(cytidine 5'-diphospho)-2-C-methyl-D-erythritol kinase [Planctomycetota bacterium]
MFSKILAQPVHHIRFASSAKLNLFLEIKARRSDGFHELETVMSKFSLFDDMTFVPNDTGRITLSVDSPQPELARLVPSDESNLIVRSLQALLATVDQDSASRMGMTVSLLKRIPVQAGLGGASGNSAAALVAGNQLWGLGLSLPRLMEIGGGLGSDIPFFLGSGFCKCTGRGEQIENLNCAPRFNILVAKPKFGLSTPEIYSRCQVPEAPINSETLIHSLRTSRLAEFGKALFNRLEFFAGEMHDGIRRMRDEFARTNSLGHAMTGSGSCYFGLYRSYAVMMAAKKLLTNRMPEVAFFAGHTLGRPFNK